MAKSDSQRQSAAQIFEFVTFEDAHRARSYAMRQSWRKRKQKILSQHQEDSKAGENGNGSKVKPVQRKRRRPLAAKKAIKSEGLHPEDGFQALVAKDVDCMDTDSELNTFHGDIDNFNFGDEMIYVPNDYEQFLNMSDQDLQYLASFGQDDLMNIYYDELLSEAFPTVAMDQILSPLALDPFDTFPISLTTRHHELLHHWLTSHSAMVFDTETPSALNISFNPMRDVWFPLDLSNAASFYGIMAHSAAHLAYLHGQKHAVEVLKYKSEAVSLINQWMQDEKTALEDATFAAVVRLLTFERYWGTEAVWRIHRDGLDRMIQARGGLASLKKNWRLGLVLQLISLMSKPSWFYPSNNISEISDSFSYLRITEESASPFSEPSTPTGLKIYGSNSNNSEIPKLRSLWLISFIQDMRSLMANSSNLQSVGLWHYHSIYEAVTILRSSFLESMRHPEDATANVHEHDRIACLFYIGVMIQECVSSKYHNTIATAAPERDDNVKSISPSNLSMCTVDVEVDEKSYDRLATLDKEMRDHKSIWMASIPQLEGFLLNHFMNHLGNVNRAEYVLHMTEVLTSLSREARNGVERCLLNMFGGRYSHIESPISSGTAAGIDKEWTVDELLMSIHGG
ncbi:hypothetical protein TSTA_059210 [Talaromyces stipitatus ATCC 10500]|uniref:Transcription factor domain-containing protein n=1 Tax=Talaromyces stipitatus (strain ATCC 10500 / CBS 375.48 / QM 6759 / NRRL 1006) TaxID=441959 RepID=B8MRZ8_TALSN|nr:uncharacterized protein TSTA_059210 [Talaromyces stipitatus ATCC 10500]EED13434.1 hypothetical protein TSTA_059210 [Talaromyces stipitatus ATCC 10500]